MAKLSQRFAISICSGTVRPEITGRIEVNGHRGILMVSRISLSRGLRLFYIQNRSLMFDVRICALTVLTVFRDRNAF